MSEIFYSTWKILNAIVVNWTEPHQEQTEFQL